MDKDLESLYKEAQSALKAKDFDRASDLLRQILLSDENYKDVSRLLAQTVKLRRRRWYNHPILWSVLGFVMVVALGFFIAPRVRGFFTVQPAMPVIASQTATFTVIATATETLLPTPTPVPLTWKRIAIGQEFERDTVTALVIDSNDPDVLYAGMQNAGIYKSIDGGLSWRPTHHGLANAHITSLLIDFNNPQVLYAGTLEGIYETEDGAENWSKIGTGHYLLMDPQNSSHLYARDSDEIRESTDQGKNWKTIYSSKEGCPGKIISWDIHPIDGRTLFIGAGEECEAGVYMSTDGGHTWAIIWPAESIHNFDAFEMGVDKQGNYYIVWGGGLSRNQSNNGGISWRTIADFIPPATFDSTGLVYAYCDSHLCKFSLDEEQMVTLGKSDAGVFTTITISPYDPNTIYVGGEGLSVSRDGGLTWTKLNNGMGSGTLQLDTGSGDVPILYIQPGECDASLYPWLQIMQSLYISTNDGGTWNLVSQIGCHLIKDANGETVYRIDYYSDWIWRSRDGGSSWEKVQIPTRSRKIITFVAHPSKSGTLYAYFEDYGDGVLAEYFSEDYGHTWKRMDPATSTKPCYGSTLQFIDAYRPMAIDPSDGNHVLVIDNGTLLESHDSCETTQTFGTAPNTSMNSIVFNSNNPDTLYAGTDEGAYISFDSGQTWGEVNDGLLGATVVYSIAVDKNSNVYAATPYGVFKLEGK